MSETDKQLAERVLQTLQTAHYTNADTALREIAPLREQVGSGANVEGKRAETWLAISVLHKTLSANRRDPQIEAHWQKAIEKANAWVESLGS